MTAITGEPAYRQVANDLRAKILDGSYPVGEALPATVRLMAIYEVSITVVRAAVRDLQIEGILVGQPGKGVFVARRPDDVPDVPTGADVLGRLDELTETVQRLEARVSDLESRDSRSV